MLRKQAPQMPARLCIAADDEHDLTGSHHGWIRWLSRRALELIDILVIRRGASTAAASGQVWAMISSTLSLFSIASPSSIDWR